MYVRPVEQWKWILSLHKRKGDGPLPPVCT